MVLITFWVVSTRDELHKLAWVLAASIGYYGIKGGTFTILTGGSYKVWGPEGSFIADNNSLALAIIMVVPLFRYLQLHSVNRWVRRGCMAAMLLCVAAAVGSYSRGALLGLGAMGAFLWLKSPNKALLRHRQHRRRYRGLREHARKLVEPHEHDRHLQRGRLGDGAHQRLVDGLEPGAQPHPDRRRLRRLHAAICSPASRRIRSTSMRRTASISRCSASTASWGCSCSWRYSSPPGEAAAG